MLSRPGSVLLMNDCAVLIAPSQFDIQPGWAHSVITLEKPASLPPTEIVTYFVVDTTALSCELVTVEVVAPEQALKLSV